MTKKSEKNKKKYPHMAKCIRCGNETKVLYEGDEYCVRCKDRCRDCGKPIDRGDVRCYDCSISY